MVAKVRADRLQDLQTALTGWFNGLSEEARAVQVRVGDQTVNPALLRNAVAAQTEMGAGLAEDLVKDSHGRRFGPYLRSLTEAALEA